MCAIGRNITTAAAFIVSPMSPVFFHMVYELMLSGGVSHLSPMVFICSLYGYMAMIFVALPMYLCFGKTIPEFKTLLVLGASLGAFTAMLLFGSLVFFVSVASLEESWGSDLLDVGYTICGGALFGAISGSCFWFIAYSRRSAPDASE